MIEKRDPVSDEAYRALLDLFMVSDPWPLGDTEKMYVYMFLNAEADKRDFDDWTDAYHNFDP